jgi:hypothetical protein
LIKPNSFDGFDHTIQGTVEGIQGHIQRTAFCALVCCWIPEFHTPILFEDLFDDKSFSQQNKEKTTKNLRPTTQPNATDPFPNIPRNS